jgi:hypothetical protein
MELRIGDRTALLAHARFTESGICLQQSLLLLAFDHVLRRRPKFRQRRPHCLSAGPLRQRSVVPSAYGLVGRPQLPRHATASVKVTTVFIIIVVALLPILISVSMYQAVPARKSAENPDTLPCAPIFVGWGRFFREVYPLDPDIVTADPGFTLVYRFQGQ